MLREGEAEATNSPILPPPAAYQEGENQRAAPLQMTSTFASAFFSHRKLQAQSAVSVRKFLT